MKKLILVRHGKSSWDFPVKDIDRDLIEKGIQNSILVAKSSINLIDSNSVFWSSNATRANKTAHLFLENWNISQEKLTIKPSLYTFDHNELKKIICQCPDDINSLILFGHNNAITDFVNQFGSEYINNVPTSGLVKITFETNFWSEIKNGKTTHIIFPKNLE
jgi:phosphohistidine phosphatase